MSIPANQIIHQPSPFGIGEQICSKALPPSEVRWLAKLEWETVSVAPSGSYWQAASAIVEGCQIWHFVRLIEVRGRRKPKASKPVYYIANVRFTSAPFPA